MNYASAFDFPLLIFFHVNELLFIVSINILVQRTPYLWEKGENRFAFRINLLCIFLRNINGKTVFWSVDSFICLPDMWTVLLYYGSTALCWALTAFSVLNPYTVGRTPLMGDQPVARPLPTQNKRTQTSMPRVGFELTTPVFERAKTVHALDRATTVIGMWTVYKIITISSALVLDIFCTLFKRL
jgi:hypothetical protein